MTKSETIVESFKESVQERVDNLSECSCLSQDELNGLTNVLELYKQDHNADHLFDYLTALHASFVDCMNKDCCDAKDPQAAEEPATPAPTPVYADPEAAAVEIPVADGAEAIIPAEVILKKEEMKVEPPTETATEA